MNPRLVELIYVPSTRGDGTPQSPRRIVHELWTKDGRLVAATDDFATAPKGNFRIETWGDVGLAAACQ